MKPGELRRSKPLARAYHQAPRRALPAKSRQRIAEADPNALVRAAVFARDGYRCRLWTVDTHDQHPGVTFHHLRKAGQGGAYTAENGIALCGSCNVWVEDEPLEAWRLGLVQRAGETIKVVWARLHRHGLSSGPQPGSPPLQLSYDVRRGDQEAPSRLDHPDGHTTAVPDLGRVHGAPVEGGAS